MAALRPGALSADPFLGWLGLAGMAVTGLLLLDARVSRPSPRTPSWPSSSSRPLLHVPMSVRPRPATIYVLFQVALLATVVLAVVPTPDLGAACCFAVHLLAMVIWLGHMFFWSFVVGPLCKRYQPEERREAVREASHRWGALGGGALARPVPDRDADACSTAVTTCRRVASLEARAGRRHGALPDARSATVGLRG